MKKLIADKNKTRIENLYWNQRLPTTEIAKIFGVRPSVIWFTMRRLGISTRGRGGHQLGILHWHWKGGRYQRPDGYIGIKLSPDDFFYSMVHNGYVAEHRLILARHLGRCLQPFEIVHHKNGVRDDNRIENLELAASRGEHSSNHSKGYHDGFQKGYYDGKDKRIKELESRITELESLSNLKELKYCNANAT